ncbi:hypothetical protein U1Q18_036055, partial [Sarracenia purpurea var. burkii]
MGDEFKSDESGCVEDELEIRIGGVGSEIEGNNNYVKGIGVEFGHMVVKIGVEEWIG